MILIILMFLVILMILIKSRSGMKIKSFAGNPLLRAAALLLLFMSFAAGPAWPNGNTTADAPDPAAAPITKSIRKAPVKKRPARKTAAKKTAAGKTAKATAKTKARKAAPAARTSSLDRGIALMEQERYEAARPWLQKAVQENRRSAAAWYWYGMYHDRTGKFHEAQYFFTKAVQCDPTFEPLSRVMVYPNDGEKNPLWDPKRPARIYPVPTDQSGVAIIPPDAPQARRRPARPPIDPDLPRVPAYMPPEPGATPADGDAWQPSVYVPPSSTRALEGGDPAYVPPGSLGGRTPGLAEYASDVPAYVPPSSGRGETAQLPGASPVYQPPLPGGGAQGNAPVYQSPLPDAGRSGGAPVYQPPLPGEQQPQAVAAAPSKPRPAAKRSTVPTSRTVKKKPAARAKPKTSQTPKAQEPKVQEPVVREPEPVQIVPPEKGPAAPAPEVQPPIRQEPEFLPPVGQGTGAEPSETALPPVGQGEPGPDA